MSKFILGLLCFFGQVSMASVDNQPRNHGREVRFYENKKMESQRFYDHGAKVGVHQTWYPSGKLKSRSTFLKPNSMNRFEEWHDNGNRASIIEFENGMEVSTKIYRRSGQIYVNRVLRNGRMYGLPGGKACFRVKENGEVL